MERKMSDITVKNDTVHNLHIAFAWSGIVQYYENDLAPGETKKFSKFGIGFSDFTAIVGNDENKFSHDKDFLGALAIGGIVGGVLIAAAGIALIPFTGATSTALTAAGVSTAVTAASVGVAVSGAVITVAGIVLEVADATLEPASIKAVDVGLKQTITVAGGEVTGDIKVDENGQPVLDDNGNATMVVASIAPLTATSAT